MLGRGASLILLFPSLSLSFDFSLLAINGLRERYVGFVLTTAKAIYRCVSSCLAMGDLLQFVSRAELEQRKVRAERPDWKEWIPVYGLHVAMQDAICGRPSFLSDTLSESMRDVKTRYQAYQFGVVLLALTYPAPYA